MKECKECLEQARLLGISGEREAKLLARIEILEAQESVRGGEFCAESRSRGRDMCGTCAWCVNFFKQKYELASVRIAELERALKSVAAYVKDGECYCLNGEENLGRNPCGWCVAEREIKSVLGKGE